MQLNQGISFGLLPGISVWIEVIFVVLLGVYAVMPAHAGKTRELWGRIGLLMMIVGGGLNVFSRVVHGGVLDYWNFLGLFYNNLADYLIFFGIVVYGCSYFVRRH